MKIFNTICEVTNRRQKEVRRIAQIADLMIVIGGRKSANTSRLAAIASEEGCETHHIETALDVNKDWIAGKSLVGITAGSSTPIWIINEVIDKLNQIAKKKEEVLHEGRL